MRKFRRLLLLTLTSIFVMTGMSRAQLRSDFEEQWKSFREAFPYHTQILGLSPAAQDGHRLLLISEPPPHVTLDGVRTLDGRLSDISEKEHPIGVDGWVKDLRIDLPPIAQPELNELLDSLSNYLFFTSYKSAILALPIRPKTNAVYPLDVKVSAADLNDALFAAPSTPRRQTGFFMPLLLIVFSMIGGLLLYAICLRRWVDSMRHPFRLRLLSFLSAAVLSVLLCFGYRFWPAGESLDAEHSFIPVNGGDPVTPEKILDQNRAGVFLSEQPGLVLWSFLRNSPISEHPAEIRQFAVDSDLILGAVKKGDCVLVVARERSVPVDVLPPLRTETILQLASVKTDELGQSYERTNIVSGKLSSTAGADQGKDWAPIYLSDELIDTEYGSQMNIADQLLKSWSMHGEVQYDAFTYPDPPQDFPFTKNLLEWANTGQVTFNWNTKGAGYIAEKGPYEIYALNRTGALPIDYLAGDNSRLREAEDKAYDKFAGYSNPDLVRVVQYAALYQIFRQFELSAQGEATNRRTTISPVLKAGLREVVNWILSRNMDQLRMAALRTAGAEPEKAKATFQELVNFKENLVDLQSRMGEAGLIDFLADRNTVMRESIEKQEFLDVDLLLTAAKIQQQAMHLALPTIMGLDIRNIEQMYRREQDGTGRQGWIRTASVVQSRGNEVTGGHNLSARTVSFKPSTGVDANHVNVKLENGQQIIEYNPADFSKIDELVRPAARDERKSDEEIKKLLEEKMPQAAQSHPSLRKLINFDRNPGIASERGFVREQAPELASDLGWQASRRAASQREGALVKAASIPNAPAVIITRLPDGGYSVAHGLSPKAFPARNLPQAIDMTRSFVEDYSANGSPGITVYLSGFEPRPGRSFSGTLENHLSATDRDKVSVVVEGRVFTPEEVERIFSHDYDFSNAAVERISEATKEPEGDWSVTADLKVPARKSGIRVLWMRIKVRFKELTAPAREVVAAIGRVIREWQASIANLPEKIRIMEATRSLRKRLRAVDPGVSVETTFHEEGSEGRDLYADHRNWQRDGRAYHPA
jgi:hypothetical protein